MACGCIPFSALTLTKNKTGACCKRLPTIGGLTGGGRRRLRRTASTRARVEIAQCEHATNITYFERKETGLFP